MRARFITTDLGYVSLSYDVDDYDGVHRVTRTFFCPDDGGYVREYRNGDWKQVCVRLNYMGSTLRCSSRDKLLTLIRREYKAMRREEKREASRYI